MLDLLEQLLRVKLQLIHFALDVRVLEQDLHRNLWLLGSIHSVRLLLASLLGYVWYLRQYISLDLLYIKTDFLNVSLIFIDA